MASKASTDYFPALNLLRGVAALLVAFGHGRNLFFCDYGQIEHPGVALRAFYFLSGLGHESVVIFFVLSGFVIANSIHNSFARGGWSWRDYLVARLSRLWIVLIPALLLGGFLDLTGAALPGPVGSLYHATGFGHIILGTELDNVNLTCLAGNVFFLQTIAVPTFGSNGPLWSLANEFWYYLCFPLMLVGLKSLRTSWRGVFPAMIGAAVLVLAGPKIAGGYLIWLLGCLSYIAMKRRLISSKRVMFALSAGGSLILLVALSVNRFHQSHTLLGEFGSDLILGIAVALLVYAISQPSVSCPAGLLKLGELLARPSYSLYLLHLPFLVFVASLLFHTNQDRWPPDLLHLGMGLGIALLCFGYVGLIYSLTEARTSAFRSWFRRRVDATIGRATKQTSL